MSMGEKSMQHALDNYRERLRLLRDHMEALDREAKWLSENINALKRWAYERNFELK